MSRGRGWCTAALLALGVWVTGCGGSTKNNNNDGGVTTVQVCVPNATSCFSDTIALTCTSTGSAEIPVQCGSGQKCTNGACVAAPNAACTSAANACTDATHATVCTSSGTMSVTCPTGTSCVGPGLCQGACVVGSSICLDDGTISVCNDGMTYTSMACGTGMGCVTTGTSPFNTAACKPAACKPDPNGCDFVCGDLTGGTGTAANTMSTCVSTPNGFKWLAVTCTGAQTCNSIGGACTGGNGGTQAACTSQCNPGDTRCNADQTGYQTCGMNGTWGATVTACNADPTQAKYACATSATGEGVCADLACIAQNMGPSAVLVPSGQGVCDSSGKFHACGSDGKVSTDAQACTNGTCVTTGDPAGGLNPGQCVTECQNGDARCVGGSSYQTCANGIWSTSTQCASGKSCIDTTAMNGQPAYFCGDCLPGKHTCSGAQIVTCGSDGTYGMPADCAMGTCEQNAGDALCLLQCTPGSTVCAGTTVQDPSTGIDGTDHQGTCTAQGTLPAPANTTACATSTLCRKNAAGTALGCVACVGSDNEYGLTDTRCENATDTASENNASGGYVESCKADNSGWDMANHTQCIAPNPICRPPSTNIPAASSTSFCELVPFFGPGPERPLTNANINAYFASRGQPQIGCAGVGLGTPESCNLAAGGSVPDCCTNACHSAPQPTPAYCN